jgi:hypothetical protein
MFQACRPAGRLFYLALTVLMSLGAWPIAVEASAGERPSPEARPRAAEPAPRAASPAPQSGPPLTSVIDTVYLADGTPALGTLIITWPAFVTAGGSTVAGGSLNMTLGTNGALNVALASNSGATPAGVYYTVVYQLQPSEVKTQYWVVPTSSPATLAQVITTPGSGTAAQPVSMQYVNSQLATKANDNAVVHLAGSETVTGTKTFAAPPSVPNPVGTGDVANKAYVDDSIAAVGAGNYLPTAGGSMTGPLTLSANPTAPLQATPKQYVDSSVAVKADLISGTVPTDELGTGVASGLNCLLGSGSWGPCGSSANATAIQSVPVASSAPGDGQVLAYSASSGQYAPATPSGATGGVTVTPGASQSIAQPIGTQFSVNNQSGARYVTVGDNWSVSPTGSLTAGTQATITLAPCPVGVDTSGFSMYYVYLTAQGAPEPAMVTGGTCSPGAASGTIVFTPRNSHSAGYKISSASSGIQEAINDACGLPGGVNEGNPNAKVILPATGALGNALPVYGSIFAHCSRALVEGNGTLLSCSTRDRCMVLGDLVNSNHYGGVTVRGVNFTSTLRQDGCQVTNTQRQSNVVTIVTASACSTIQTGDTVNINFTDSPAYWGNHGPVTVSGTSITYNQTGGNLAAVASPGTIAIENAAIEDNATPGTMEDIKSSSGGGGNFNQFFVMDDDEQATIRNFDADGSQALLCTANHCGSYIYSWGGSSGAPVISASNMNISPQCGGNGVTVYGNNTVRITDSVIQGFGMWAVNTQTLLGNFGGTTLENVYMEEGNGPCVHPYEGDFFGATGIIFEGNVQPLLVRGGEQPGGHVPVFSAQNSGGVQYNYYVVANDTTTGWHSAPFFAGYAMTNGTGSVAGQFPHIPPASPGDTVTYDVLRLVPPGSLTASTPSFPEKGACTGGSTAACGSVITGQAQCTGLVCGFTDSSTAASTANYTLNSLSWTPVLPFWPAGVLLTGPGGIGYITPSASFDTEPPDVVSVNWNTFPQVFVRYCSSISLTGNLFGGAMEECQEGNPNTTSIVGTLLNDGLAGIGTPAGLKGRLNFESISSAAHHIITLVDSNMAKTTSTIGFRPPNDANDTYIGLDNASSTPASGAQLALGAPVSISEYIGNKGDNTSFLERLTASGKTFNLPVIINGNLTVTGTCTGCGGGGSGSGTVNSGTATQVALYAANGAAVSGDSGLTDSGSTLTYSGSNGIAATAGSFSGNVTVNGQLLLAGPWSVSSPIPGTAMSAAGAGTSALGISNDGNFYISANGGTPQKVVTTATSSFFSNLFQEDANDLGEYNGTTAQNFHVYSSYTNSSTWQRTSLGFDSTDNYAVVRSENAVSGTAPGLGFWINSGLKWVIDGASNFKPWTDQSFNIGSFSSSGSGSGLRPGTVYVAGNSTSGSGFELGRFASESYELCNDATTGTLINGLATLTSAGCAIKPPSTLSSGAIGVVIANAGTSGVATLAKSGSAFCSFDGTATVIGDYVVPSSTSGSFYLCHDAGGTRPTGTQILGRVLQASSGSTTVQMFLDMPGSSVSSGTPPGVGSCTNQAVTAVNTGAAPTCTTVTSAYVDSSIAPTSSPAFTGTPTAPTPSTSDSSTKIATTAWVNAQGYGTGSGNVTGPTSSTSGDIATFSVTNGKTIQDSGTAVSSLAPLASPALTGAPTAPSASVGDNSTKIATTAYVKNEAQFAWTCPVAGSTSVSQNCNWTLPAALTITGFDFAANTAPAGCSTNATVQLWDGTANAEVGSYSIALSSGNSFYTQVTGSTNVASGHQLRVKVTTAASGCTTSAGGLVATVTYQMQN